MNIRPPTDEAIDEAVARLRAGELIGLPTETVYGLAGDASIQGSVGCQNPYMHQWLFIYGNR